MGPGRKRGGRGVKVASLDQLPGQKSRHVLVRAKERADIGEEGAANGLRRDVDSNEVGLLGFGRIGVFNHLFGRNHEAHPSNSLLRVDMVGHLAAGVAETDNIADLHFGPSLR